MKQNLNQKVLIKELNYFEKFKIEKIQKNKKLNKEECYLTKKKVLVILAILTAVIVSFVGGQSYSKYISEVKGEGTAEVAGWSFKVNGSDSQVQTISLASTVNNKTLVDNKIAPGTSGSFNILVDCTGSDVGINYNIQFTNETSKPTNLKFTYENVEYNSVTELANALTGVINANDENKTKTLNVKWNWKYETGSNDAEISSNDKIDTQNAKAIQNYQFNVIVSGTQVIPQ